MPFDFMPTQPILDPSVRDLPPRERLIVLRDALRAGEADEGWNYCKGSGCAIGAYQRLAGAYPTPGEFQISDGARRAIFINAGYHTPRRFRWLRGEKFMWNVTPRDVANVIDLVLRGEIQ